MRPTVGILLILLAAFGGYAQQKKVVFRTLPTQTTLLVDGKERGEANNQKIILGYNERKGIITHEIVITAPGYVDEIITMEKDGPRYFERTVRLERKLPRVAPQNEFVIDLEKVISGLEYSTDVGAKTRWKYRYDEEIDLTAKRTKVLDAFQRMGLKSTDPRNADLFNADVDTDIETDIVVAGRVMKYELFRASKGSWSGGYYYTSKARIKWQFYDRHTQEVIHDKEVKSEYEFTTSLINEEFFNSIVENFYSLWNNNNDLVQMLRTYEVPEPIDTIVPEQDTIAIDTVGIDTFASLPDGVEPIFIESPEASSSFSFANVSKRAANASVSLTVGDNILSGVLVSSKGHIVTKAVDVSSGDKIDVRFSNGISLPASVLRTDTGVGLSLLLAEADGFTALPIMLNTQSVENELEAFVVASPKSQSSNQAITRGVLSVQTDSSNVRALQFNKSLDENEAGSALLNMKGEILGILSENGGREGETSHAVVIDAAYLRTALGITYE